MKKTAFIYDKWLNTLGGGEMVACQIAKTLYDQGYETTFIAGNIVDKSAIKNHLGIDMTGIKFIEVWNDEDQILKLTKSKDIFVNASYMDYSLGSAKKNYYYTSFPTKANNNFKAYILNNLLLPIASKYIKPLEFSSPIPTIKEEFGHLLYLISPSIEIKFSYLHPGKPYLCKFSVYYTVASKYAFEHTNYSLTDAKLLKKNLIYDHLHNVLHFHLTFVSSTKTIGLSINFSDQNNQAFLINPRIVTLNPLTKNIFSLFEQRAVNRLRAGYFYNISERMKKFNIVFANSQYTSFWIKKYWNCESHVLYPPVNLFGLPTHLSKKNWICSVGRFFTLGHGKKQEFMIEAFKKMCDEGLTEWELHLAGGLGAEPSSIEFAARLNQAIVGYPIYLHFNQSRQFIEDLYRFSKIYWHAAGYGEDRDKEPIKFEHFGIAPIEAMSAGCIPVLFNGGGLSEVVTLLNLDPQIHLFNTINQLVDQTKIIIKQDLKLPTDINQRLESLFSLDYFKKQFMNLISANNQQTEAK